jgi:hypothetical protein
MKTKYCEARTRVPVDKDEPVLEIIALRDTHEFVAVTHDSTGETFASIGSNPGEATFNLFHQLLGKMHALNDLYEMVREAFHENVDEDGQPTAVPQESIDNARETHNGTK